MILIWLLVLTVFLLDQAAKKLVSSALLVGESFDIGSVFSVTLTHNSGVAFGLFKNATIFFIFISVASVALILSMIGKKYYTFLEKSALALVLSGALGNLADRLRFGYVVDFIDFKIWPVFNIADSAITVGAILLIFSILRKSVKPDASGSV